MSYNFQVRAESKTAVILAAEAAYKEQVVAKMPVHSIDEATAFKNLREHLALLPEPNADEDVTVNMYGSIWVDKGRCRAVGNGCSVGLLVRR